MDHAETPARNAEAPLAAVHVALVHPEIPWNVGNAGRTCLAVGARLHLVRPLGFSLDAREVRRAGLDYWERVSPRVWTDLADLEAGLDDLGEPYLLSAEGGRTVWDVDYPERTILFFGRESTGLPEEFRDRHRDCVLRIPATDHSVRSLNLSTAVAITLFEVLRQQHVRRQRHLTLTHR